MAQECFGSADLFSTWTGETLQKENKWISIKILKINPCFTEQIEEIVSSLLHRKMDFCLIAVK